MGFGQWHRTKWNGNTVEQVEYRQNTCDTCGGEGCVKMSYKEIRFVIHSLGLQGVDGARLMQIYRLWKSNDAKVECPDCEGEGSWEERR